MKNYKIAVCLLILAAAFSSCSYQDKNNNSQGAGTISNKEESAATLKYEAKPRIENYNDSLLTFEKNIYLKIDEMHTGPAFDDGQGLSAFYRILVVPEEENIMLIAEKISIGAEGGGYKLIKLSRVTNEKSALSKFNLSSVDSLKFTDSITVEGLFNNNRRRINLRKLKPYHF